MRRLCYREHVRCKHGANVQLLWYQWSFTIKFVTVFCNFCWLGVEGAVFVALLVKLLRQYNHDGWLMLAGVGKNMQSGEFKFSNAALSKASGLFTQACADSLFLLSSRLDHWWSLLQLKDLLRWRADNLGLLWSLSLLQCGAVPQRYTTSVWLLLKWNCPTSFKVHMLKRFCSTAFTPVLLWYSLAAYTRNRV